MKRGTALEILDGPYRGRRGVFIERTKDRDRFIVEIRVMGKTFQTRLALERSQIRLAVPR
jgi:transcription antitermination factor NusG